MRDTLLLVFALLAWQGGPPSETAASSLHGPCGAIAGDLVCASNPGPDPGPAPSRSIDEFLEREKNEDDSEDPVAYGPGPDGVRGLPRTPRPRPVAPGIVAAALRTSPPTAPMRC
ncbi:hypothetical protein [Paludisphaera mucosa]|uniref:Uncharacterized protein n=1 Tax=Paludisphaera mucosa TaxID=3030827 RepID=A0ABT6F8I4_9BACT|nr:hypothetical protein [Paludisphaera mucosa]MDG3003900.1 hypothetical protein [Paludisphaera mucosa]